MFKHILIPTDGSTLAAKGARAGLKLARALGARVSGVYVIQPYLAPVYADVPYLPAAALEDYAQASKAQGMTSAPEFTSRWATRS